MNKNKKNLHSGSNFDDFLKEEDLYEEVCAAAAEQLTCSSPQVGTRRPPVQKLKTSD